VLARLLVTPFLTELDTNHRDIYYSEHILEAPVSVSSSIQLKQHVPQKCW